MEPPRPLSPGSLDQRSRSEICPPPPALELRAGRETAQPQAASINSLHPRRPAINSLAQPRQELLGGDRLDFVW